MGVLKTVAKWIVVVLLVIMLLPTAIAMVGDIVRYPHEAGRAVAWHLQQLAVSLLGWADQNVGLLGLILVIAMIVMAVKSGKGGSKASH